MAFSSASSSSSSSSRNCVFDVFPSFSGEDVRKRFLSHFLQELDRKLITAFKDNEIERSQSLDPELKQAIRDSRIAIVIFSKMYASSSWCLNELLEIVKCKQELGQLVIPIFYDLEPSHVRKQTGEFGKEFDKTCLNKTQEETQLWRKALTDVANILGYHSNNWDNEATMIQEIAIDVVSKLTVTNSDSQTDFVGIEDHISKMSLMLSLEAKDVRKVGIWGPSGIGKTTVARTLFSRFSGQFQGSIFIDRSFISKIREYYRGANPDDYNMKLYLQGTFLSKLLGKKNINVDDLDKVGERLMHRRVFVVVDDLDDQMVLDTLVGRNQLFGPGSRIIVITKDKHLLRGHGIKCIYEMDIPSEKLALEIFCRSAFGQHYPPDGFMELASEVVIRAGGLPLGLYLLGSALRGRDKEYWLDMLPSLRKGLDGKIEKALRVSYDGLDRKEHKAIFRHIACFFNGEDINKIKWMLADSELNVNIGLKILVDKSLIRVIPSWHMHMVEMHCLVQEMGKEIVRAQSDEPREREFLMDSKDICDVLEDNIGTNKVLGVSLDIEEADELQIHKEAFKGMRNLRFLKIYTNKRDTKKEVGWQLGEGLEYFPPKLRLLSWDRYPMRCLPYGFRPGNLVELQMAGSKLEKLWEGIHSLTGLKNIHLSESKNLKEIPDLSMATNLKELDLLDCSSLVDLPSSIQYLNNLEILDMEGCINVKTLPSGINLQSLRKLDLGGCSQLRVFPDISSNIEVLILDETSIDQFPDILNLKKLVVLSMRKMKSEKLWERAEPLTPLINMLSPTLERLFLSDIPSLVQLPSSIQIFSELVQLVIRECINLETLPTGINFQYLDDLDLTGCSRLRTFPDISTNISELCLSRTGIEEVPWWIENFSRLRYLYMNGCDNLQCVSLHILKLEDLEMVDFSNCRALTKASLNDRLSDVAVAVENIHSESTPDNFIINCFNLVEKAFFQGKVFFKFMILSGEEVPSYFTHHTTGTSLTNIPILHTSLSQTFFKIKACAVVDSESSLTDGFVFHIHVSCRFEDRLGNHFDSSYQSPEFLKDEKGIHLVIFECSFPLDEDDTSLVELNYEHMDVHLHISNSSYSTSKLKGWGIRLFEDCSSHESGLNNPNSLPHVCEADEDNMHGNTPLDGLANETEDNDESGDNNVNTERSWKRMRIT